MLRLRRDLGPTSTLGVAYTDRIDGDDYNACWGSTRTSCGARSGSRKCRSPVRGLEDRAAAARASCDVTFGDRTGRGVRQPLRAARHPEELPGHERVRESDGLRRRPHLQPVQLVRPPGRAVEQFTAIVGFAPIWRYSDFGRLNRTIEDTLQTFWIATLRGGWQSQVTLNLNHFGFDGADYAGYTVGAAPFVVRTTCITSPAALSS